MGDGEHVAVTPLPILKMTVVGMVLLNEALCTTMLLPFVGLFVSYLEDISLEAAGYLSGILVGLCMLGQVISAKVWGRLSDVYGRKVPLSVGLLAGSFCMLFFGMSSNFYLCCVLRFVHGVFNGNVLIAKIMVADVTDETNEAKGFSMLGLLWSVGAMIGPAVGGFLYDPAVNPRLGWLHVTRDSYVGQHPAFVPSTVIFVYSLSTFLATICILTETNKHRTKTARDFPVVGWILNVLKPRSGVVVDLDANDAEDRQSTNSPPPPPPKMTYAKAYNDPVIWAIIMMLMCISSSDMAFAEIMPLWAIAPREVGGLGMFSDDVGILILCFSIPTFFVNLMFSTMYRWFDNLPRFWRAAALVFLLAVGLLPVGASFSPRGGFWFTLLIGSLKNSSCSTVFSIFYLTVAKAAPPGTVGSVYGIAESFGVGMRCLVPFVVAPVFAWSVSGDHPFPFNSYFVFILSTFPLLYSMYLTHTRRIERTQDELDDMDPVSVGERDQQEDHISLASSFSPSQAAAMGNALSVRRDEAFLQIHEWSHQMAPHGRGEAMERAVIDLKHEDYRVVVEDDL